MWCRNAFDAAAGVGADQHLAPLGLGQLGQRRVEDRDVVGGGVRRGRPGAQHPGQGLPGAVLAVVDERAHRVEPEAALEGRRGQLLLRVRGHQRGVQVDDHLAPRPRRPADAAEPRPAPGPPPARSGSRPPPHRRRRPAWRSAATPSDQRRPARTAAGWARTTATSAKQSPPSATAIARSSSTLPGSWPARSARHGASAADRLPLQPRSAALARRTPRPTRTPTTRGSSPDQHQQPGYASPTECLPLGRPWTFASPRIPSRTGTYLWRGARSSDLASRHILIGAGVAFRCRVSRPRPEAAPVRAWS